MVAKFNIKHVRAMPHASRRRSAHTLHIILCQQSARRPQFSVPCRSESRMRKLCLHYGDFVQGIFNLVDEAAGRLEPMVRTPMRKLLVVEATVLGYHRSGFDSELQVSLIQITAGKRGSHG